jgi:hypothetical protein
MGECMCDLAAQPIVVLAYSVEGTGLQQNDEVLARLDLAEDRPFEFTAVEVLQVHECVEVVLGEFHADQQRQLLGELAPIGDKDGTAPHGQPW